MSFDKSVAMFLERIEQVPAKRLSLWTIVLLFLVAVFDYVTGPELSTSLFYLGPIALAGWYLGRQRGLIAAHLGAALWLANVLLGGQTYSHAWLPFWNAGVRLGIFALFVLALSYARGAQLRQQALLSFLVHDLRAPMSVILTSLGLLRGELGSTWLPNTVATHLVEMGITSGERMLQLIDAILDLNRLEERKMPLDLRPLNTGAVLREAAGQIELVAGSRAVQLTCDADAALPAVLADATLFQRICMNLLNNAVKFSPAGGKIGLGAVVDDGAMLFWVQDEGPGIPAEWRKQVFSRFAQVEARQKGVAVGSGLGLTFCKMALEAQGGRIWVDPDWSPGARFCWTLPLAPIKREPERQAIIAEPTSV